MLQLLRIFADAVQETIDPIKDLSTSWRRVLTRTKSVISSRWTFRFDDASQVSILENWDTIGRSSDGDEESVEPY